MKRFTLLACGLLFLVSPALAQTYKLVMKDEAGNEYLDDRIRFDKGGNALHVRGVDVFMGQEGVHGHVLPFRFDNANGKVITRSALFQEIGDSVDIGSGRAGPDNATPLSVPATTPPGQRMTRFYGRSYVSGCGWNGGALCNQFALNAELTFDAAPGHQQSLTSRPGMIVLRTTRPNQIGPTDAAIVDESQRMILVRAGHMETPVLTGPGNLRDTGVSWFQTGDRRFLNLWAHGKRVADFRAVTSPFSTGLALVYMGPDGQLRHELVRVRSDGTLHLW